ncbi:MAG: D-sedoheptulose-7-phosphate isomerase [Planctomycetota bacterium]|jgi:phosphoheptose isomerase
MAGSITQSAGEYLEVLSEMLSRVDRDAIDAYADLLFSAWKEDRSVFVFGNGGSAFCASHHVSDYVKTAEVEGQHRLRAFSLADNTGMLTAIGNDLSYDDVFVHQLESYAKPGDVAVAISCSGNSPNVVKACEWAREHGLPVVALTGFSGGKVGPLADIHINFPSDNYGIVEDMQQSVGHNVTQRLQSRVLEEAKRS